jgi:hypothetical protein
MEEAIAAGWARIHGVRDDEIVLLPPARGLETYRSHESRVHASFPVNPSGAAIALAIARPDGYVAMDVDRDNVPTSAAAEAAAESEGTFVVNALSTDGGGIPRNTTLDQGLALVRFGAITIEDLIRKACLNPAKMLGLYAKGHLGPGADADVIVVDPGTHKVSWSFVGGQMVVREERVVGKGGQLVTSERGRRALTEAGLPNTVVIPSWLV